MRWSAGLPPAGYRRPADPEGYPGGAAGQIRHLRRDAHPDRRGRASGGGDRRAGGRRGFGSRIDPVSAERIGLFPAGFAAKARAVGNAAGAGAAMVLLSDPIRREAEGMPAAVRTVELSSHPGFMDAYIDGMYFA